MRRKKNTVIAAGLSLVLACSVVGCGDGKKMEAEINPDTPVEEVAFPLKEKAERHLLPMRRQLLHKIQIKERSSKDWRNRRTYILTGPVLWQISLRIRKILHWLNLEIFRMDFSMRG